MTVYYKLTDGTNELLFIPQGLSGTPSRDIWEQALPFVKDKWLLDQVTVSYEVTQPGLIKPGTNRPYADYNAAIDRKSVV